MRLARVELTPGTPTVRVSNLTIINYALYILGPIHEARLTSILLLFQASCNCCALLMRYFLAGVLYDVVG